MGLKAKIAEFEKNVCYPDGCDHNDIKICAENYGKLEALKETVEMIEGKIGELEKENNDINKFLEDNDLNPRPEWWEKVERERENKIKIQALEELL